MNRTRAAILACVACSIAVALSAVPASAKTIVLRFFSKQVYSSFTGPTGLPVPPMTAPAVGDRFSFASNDYRGNHRHHAKRPFASDRVDCVVISAATALCNGQLALGGAMLFADNFKVNLVTMSAPPKVKITGGTIQYRHARGTIAVKNVGKTNNSDDTVRFTP